MSKQVVIHADWSIHDKKRWMATGRFTGGQWVVEAARLWDGGALWLSERALLGVDFPIGLPQAYAEQVDATTFVEWLPDIPDSFFDVADSAEVISLARPFYPKRPGGTRQQHLFDGLGVSDKRALLRLCDRPTSMRRAAESMFWTLGAKQVGKAMLTGWQELIRPNLSAISIWPFEGSLAQLNQSDKPVIAESYPGEFYHHLGLRFNGSKRNQIARQQCGRTLLDWASRQPIQLAPSLIAQLRDGFGASPDGEDPFDAVVGLFGMLNVLLGHRLDMPRELPEPVRKVEGWILGQTEIGQ